MSPNITTVKTASDGAWQGDNPLSYAFPLLIVQTTIILFTTRLLALLLKPLRQPKVLAEIVGGILLGPSALGRNKDILHLLFPSWSTPILESVASVGLLFFLFLIGLELDLSSIRACGKRGFGIALAGISLPFSFGVGISFFLRKAVDGEDKVGYAQYIMFIGVALSITAFPVLARILAELKLLTTQVGQTAMAAAAFNDVTAWILLAVAVTLAGNNETNREAKSPLIAIWVLISGTAFVAFMLLLVRPLMNWVARKCSSEHDVIDEAYLCLTLAGVLLSGFMTDLIGIHSIFGAFIFGLTIPKGGEFAGRLTKRIEDFVAGLMLPLYFASSGLKTNVGSIKGVDAWGLLALVISMACAGKILGTFVAAMLCMIPARESLALGVLMNTKGLVELIVLNIGKEKKVLNDEMFAILVLMALFTTFITTPAVLALYKPSRRILSKSERQRQVLSSLQESSEEELRILACIHGPGNVPALITLIESTRSASKTPVKLFVTHLLELTDRSSSIMMVQRARRNGLPFINCFSQGPFKDEIAAAFGAYNQVSDVTIHHSTIISGFSDMHEDICHVAEDQRVGIIILPFHKQWRGNQSEEAIENVGNEWRDVNQRVLNTACCLVAVLVDRGFGDSGLESHNADPMPKRVCVVFFGGADDREALALGCRMAESPAYGVTVIRFLGISPGGGSHRSSINCTEKSISIASENTENEKEMDEVAVEKLKGKSDDRIKYYEQQISSASEVINLGQCTDYDLIIVGKGAALPETAEYPLSYSVEHPEFGSIGDMLSSSDQRILPSVLVIQKNG